MKQYQAVVARYEIVADKLANARQARAAGKPLPAQADVPGAPGERVEPGSPQSKPNRVGVSAPFK